MCFNFLIRILKNRFRKGENELTIYLTKGTYIFIFYLQPSDKPNSGDC